MSPKPAVSYLSPDLAQQESYAEAMEKSGFDFSAVVMGAVVKGMRDLGYKSMGTALDELVDNAVQAEARNIHIYMGETAKPDFIAVIDDGHGMNPTMLRLSAVWGAGHHQDDGSGFGKYGYGLPSACVSMGKRFQIFSRLAGRDWFRVVVDLTEIEQGDYKRGQRVIVQPALRDVPPLAIQAYMEEHFPGVQSGTVVVIDKLDRLTWKTTKTIDRQLKQHFGLIYRNFVRTTAVCVQGSRVKAVDPLFLTPDALYFDLDDERAEALPPAEFSVKDPDSRRVVGTVRVRYSSMPAGFGRIPDDKLKTRGGKTNGRFPILDDNNGIIVLRAGRQIDVVRSKRDKELGVDFAVNNDDRYWGVEIDFDPSLDDEFSITTSKQQVNLSDRMWQLLTEHKVLAAIAGLRRKYDAHTASIRKQIHELEAGARAAERAMTEAAKFRPKPAPSRAAKGQKTLTQEAEKRAAKAGVPPAQVMPTVEAEASARFRITSEEMAPSAAFYEPNQFGGQTRVTLNEQHPFFTAVYNGQHSTPELRDAIDLLLLALADAELDSEGDRHLFYQTERSIWSQWLQVGVNRYDQIVGRDETKDDLAG